MKQCLIPLLGMIFLYLIYHIAPWPIAVLIYGCIILTIQGVVILAATIKLAAIPVNYEHRFSRSILDTFVIYLYGFTIYIASLYTIAHILAGLLP